MGNKAKAQHPSALRLVRPLAPWVETLPEGQPRCCLPLFLSFQGSAAPLLGPLVFLCHGLCWAQAREGSWKPGAGGPWWRRYPKLPAMPEPAEAGEVSCGISKCLRTLGHTTSGHLTESLLNTNCVSWAVTKYQTGRLTMENAFVPFSGS